ncbi:MAG: MopE-related protein [Pseudomonadota bacterium]
MKNLRKSPNLAMFVTVAFFTFVTLGTTLTSCGGSSSNGSSTGDSFSSFQKATTDSNGKATFTTSKLTSATSTEITLTLPNGELGSGMTVDFSETDDQHVMFIVYDPNGNYQTTFITADVSTLTASASALNNSLYLEKLPVSATIKEKDFGITTLVVIAGALLLATTGGITLQNRINKASGTIDPVRLVKGEPECFSVDDIFEYYSIATDSVGLVFWTASTLASAGATLTTDALYELLLQNITSDVQDRVKQLFWDEIVSVAFTGLNISRDTKVCWQLYSPFTDSSGNIRYNKIFEIRPDRTCTTSANCSGITPIAQTLNAIDSDGDGYTPDQSDCDDQNARIYPGAFEVCDSGIDYNCDGALTTCNVTSNAYMDAWPGGGSLTNGGSGDVSLALFQGSFIGAGSDNITEARIIVNDNIEQRVSTTSYGGGDFGWLTYVGLQKGINRIQIAGQAGTHYGSKTWQFTNTRTEDVLDIMLTWDACPGLRLYVTEPNSSLIYYGNKTGTYGSMTFAPDISSGWGPEIYEAVNPAASQTYSFYAKYVDDGSCGVSGESANYTIRIFTPYGDQVKTGTLSAINQTSSTYEVSF